MLLILSINSMMNKKKKIAGFIFFDIYTIALLYVWICHCHDYICVDKR